MQIIRSKHTLLESAGELAIKSTQEIPDWFLDDLAEERELSASRPVGDWHHLASIPGELVHKWRKEGFDVFEAPAADIMARLRAEEFTKLIATKKF